MPEYRFNKTITTTQSVDGLASGLITPALVPEAPIGLIKKGQHQSLEGGEEEEEEKEEFITSGNWRGKHNSLSRGRRVI